MNDYIKNIIILLMISLITVGAMEIVFLNEKTTSFKLENGDILVRDGHVHFYLGMENNGVSRNFGWGEVKKDIYSDTGEEIVEGN